LGLVGFCSSSRQGRFWCSTVGFIKSTIHDRFQLIECKKSMSGKQSGWNNNPYLGVSAFFHPVWCAP
jgi:hypothetical protein